VKHGRDAKAWKHEKKFIEKTPLIVQRMNGQKDGPPGVNPIQQFLFKKV